LYLFNTNYPTAADLTFASLAYPVIFPPDCDDLIITYDPNVMSRELYDQVTVYREQQEGKLVLRMYEKDRIVNRIQPKCSRYLSITTELKHMNLIFRINHISAFRCKYLFIDFTKLTPVLKHLLVHNDLSIGREMFIVMTILTNK
jgi:hypothetical protein